MKKTKLVKTRKKATVAAPAGNARWDLRLYVAGRTPKSVAAFNNLKCICDEHMKGEYHIEVIDLLKQPQLAKGDQILAIPTLVRKLPEPIKKIIGDLSNEEKVLVGLDLRPAHCKTSVLFGRKSEASMPSRRKSSDKTGLGASAKAFKKAIDEAPEGKFVLRLYVSGMTPRSRRAIDNLQKLCGEHLVGRCDLEIIDIYQQIGLAKGEQIIAAPTLVKKLPLPLRRIIGDMSDPGKILVVLGVVPPGDSEK